MPAKIPPVSRPMVGVCALLCLLIVAWRLLAATDPVTDPLLGAAWRVAIVLGSLWWVMPIRGEGWVWRRVVLVALPVLLLIALRGRALLIVLPLALLIGVVALFLRPKAKARRYDV